MNMVAAVNVQKTVFVKGKEPLYKETTTINNSITKKKSVSPVRDNFRGYFKRYPNQNRNFTRRGQVKQQVRGYFRKYPRQF